MVVSESIFLKAVLSGDGYMLDRTAGGIRGRSLRVCSVVDAEMDMSSANPYTERVRKATKMLRENGKLYSVKLIENS